jgi:hypothetical protein
MEADKPQGNSLASGAVFRRADSKLPQEQRKRHGFWLNDRAIIQLRPVCRGQIWIYCSVHGHTYDNHSYWILVRFADSTREYLALVVVRKLISDGAIYSMPELSCGKGKPEYGRSDI